MTELSLPSSPRARLRSSLLELINSWKSLFPNICFNQFRVNVAKPQMRCFKIIDLTHKDPLLCDRIICRRRPPNTVFELDGEKRFIIKSLCGIPLSPACKKGLSKSLCHLNGVQLPQTGFSFHILISGKGSFLLRMLYCLCTDGA